MHWRQLPSPFSPRIMIFTASLPPSCQAVMKEGQNLNDIWNYHHMEKNSCIGTTQNIIVYTSMNMSYLYVPVYTMLYKKRNSHTGIYLYMKYHCIDCFSSSLWILGTPILSVGPSISSVTFDIEDFDIECPFDIDVLHLRYRV